MSLGGRRSLTVGVRVGWDCRIHFRWPMAGFRPNLVDPAGGGDARCSHLGEEIGERTGPWAGESDDRGGRGIDGSAHDGWQRRPREPLLPVSDTQDLAGPAIRPPRVGGRGSVRGEGPRCSHAVDGGTRWPRPGAAARRGRKGPWGIRQRGSWDGCLSGTGSERWRLGGREGVGDGGRR